MLARDSVRFRRQLGFLHQGRLGAARVAIAGRGPVLPYLLQNLALLGFGKGCGEVRLVASGPLAAHEIDGQFLWSAHDLGLDLLHATEAGLDRLVGDLTVTGGRRAPGFDVVIELERGAADDLGGVTLLRGEVTALGCHFGTGAWPVYEPTAPGLFTASLASLCGALLAQEVLRMLGLVRPYPVERATLAMEVEFATLPEDVGLRARFDGLPLRAVESATTDAGRRFRVVLPPDLDVTWQLWERLELTATGERAAAAVDAARTPRALAYHSPFAGMSREREREWSAAATPPQLSAKRVGLGGLGGLGSWVAPLFAVSGLDGCTIDLYDKDDGIELHNLNRQVLYGTEDIGRGKAEVAAERLAELDRANRYQARPVELSLEYLREEAGAIAGLDLFLSAFDNAYARYLTGMHAYEQRVRFLDCGGGGLDGNVNLYDPDVHCILCHWGSKRDVAATQSFAHRREAQHCQLDDAGSPLLAGAMSTTSAIVASTATLVALATLAGGPAPAHQLTYLAQSNELRRCPLQERSGGSACSLHRHGEDHERHLGHYREECRHLDAMVSTTPGRREASARSGVQDDR